MAQIENYQYRSDNGLADWLKENITEMNFTQITERLSSEINNYGVDVISDEEVKYKNGSVKQRRNSTNLRKIENKIAGLDMEKALDRFDGDGEALIFVLHSIAKNTPPLLEEAAKVTKENLSEYAIMVHGLKGSFYGIDAVPVGTMAEALEKAAKAGDYDFVTANNPGFIAAAEQFIHSANEMLADFI
jgi:hypothetical protein